MNLASPCCTWCNRAFARRRDGGKPQRFCSPTCRRTYHDALAAWARDQVRVGRVTAAELRKLPTSNMHVAQDAIVAEGDGQQAQGD